MITTLIFFIVFIGILIFSMTSLFNTRMYREYFDDAYNRGKIGQYPLQPYYYAKESSEGQYQQYPYYFEKENSFSWISTIITTAGLLIAIFVLLFNYKAESNPKNDLKNNKIEIINTSTNDLKKNINTLRNDLSLKLDTLEYKIIGQRLDSMEFYINQLEKINK